MVANTDLYVTFHPSKANSPFEIIELVMKVSLQSYPDAFGGNPLDVPFTVTTTICSPTIERDGPLQMYIM